MAESELESEVQDCLDDLGYTGLTDLSKAVEAGLESAEFTGLVTYLAQELGELASLEDRLLEPEVSSQAWSMELSSLLRELGCPYTVLTQGDLTERLASVRSRLLLLSFLLSELMAVRMTACERPRDSLTITMKESPEAGALKNLLQTLGFPRPPDNLTAAQLWEKVSAKVCEVSDSATAELLGVALLSSPGLSSEQWSALEDIAEALTADYGLRRALLLTRLDATIQSFSWSERMAGREGEIGELYRAKRAALLASPAVGLHDLLAAREDLAVVEAVCSSQARLNTRTSLNKVLIGPVPDRGGRTESMAAPPPEMPSWQARQPDQGRGGGRGGNRGGHGGGGGGRGSGRVQGAGWGGGGGGGGYKGGGYSRGKGKGQLVD